MDHLVLIDGHHLMYRAFYAIPVGMKTAKGELTNAVYGVASMLISILKAEEPTHLLFCFDAGEETFRHQENATYKEGRAETPDEFYVQIPRIIELIETLGIRHIAEGKYEADDFLCAYAKEGEKAGMRVTIVTGDRDAFQLATERTRIAIPHKAYQEAEYLGPDEIMAKYGIRPDQVPDYKGLVGDSSDNLPGVQGIGPVTASKLLQDYDTLESIYEHLGDIKPTVRAKLEKDRDQAFFCQRMAQLICDMPLSVSLDETRLSNLPVETGINLMRELEFSSLIRRLETLRKTPFGERVFAQASITVESPETQMSMF